MEMLKTILMGLGFMLSLYTLATTRQKAAAQEVTAISERLARVETDIKNSVNDEDLVAIHKRVDEIAKTIGPIEGQLESINQQLSPINSNLMQMASKMGELSGILSTMNNKVR